MRTLAVKCFFLGLATSLRRSECISTRRDGCHYLFVGPLQIKPTKRPLTFQILTLTSEVGLVCFFGHETMTFWLSSGKKIKNEMISHQDIRRTGLANTLSKRASVHFFLLLLWLIVIIDVSLPFQQHEWNDRKLTSPLLQLNSLQCYAASLSLSHDQTNTTCPISFPLLP